MRTLVSFVPHMLRDYLLTRGAAMVVVTLTFILPPLLVDGGVERTPTQLRASALGTLQAISLFLTLIASYGIAGHDFRAGSFRVLFSRPVSVPLYYLALFLVALAAYWMALGLGVVVYLFAEIDAWSLPVFVDLTFSFLLLGSVIFAFSRLTRLGWIVGYMFFTLGGALRGFYPAGETWYGTLYHVVFPPAELLEPARGGAAREVSALLPSMGPEWVDMAIVGGYSLCALLVGALLLRTLPMVWAR